MQRLYADGKTFETIQDATVDPETGIPWSMYTIKKWCGVPLGETPGWPRSGTNGLVGLAGFLQACKAEIQGRTKGGSVKRSWYRGFAPTAGTSISYGEHFGRSDLRIYKMHGYAEAFRRPGVEG